MEKCISPEGKVSYLERCPPGARRAPITGGTSSSVGTSSSQAAAPAVRLGISAAPGGVEMNYYDIQGKDHASLIGALNAANSDGFHASAGWSLGYEWKPRPQPGGCGIGGFNTTLKMRMRFPRWTPPADAAPDIIARWQRYAAALRVHEDGHLDHGRSAERELKAVVPAMTAPDCGALDQALRARFNQVVEDYRKRDKEYDAQTGHGKTQGAVFN
jgi:predicted secreted Zn-dependent protease